MFMCKKRQKRYETRLLEAIYLLLVAFRKEIDKKMANFEQRLQAVSAQLDAVATKVDEVQDLLAQLRQDNPELEDEIAAIEAKVAAIGSDLDSSVPAPGPAPEQPPVA